MALTLMTLALAGAIVTSVFTVRSSLLNTLDGMLQYWGHDVRVGFRKNERAEYLVQEALAVPGVEAAEAWAFHASRRTRPDGSESGDVLIVGPARDTALISPRLRDGRWLDPADERGVVVNGDFVSDEPDEMAVGDELLLDVDQRVVSFRIVGILETTRSGPRAYVNYDALGRLTGGVGRAGSVRVVTTRHDAAFQRRVGEALEQRFTALGLGVDDVDLMSSTRESTVLQFDILIQILLVMAVLLSLVGAMGLTSTMSMNVLERTREIGVLRSVGAGHRDVLGLVLLEGMVVGVMSGIFGLLAAVPLGRAFSAAVGVAFLEGPLDHRFSWGGALLWLGASLVVAAAASLLPAWGAMRLSVREALHYE
jgi:putative ABC transport system permease protein